ncbi:MAG: alpha/beta hydrolase [Bacteroidales bacterium]|nr:alpha/beta hydrolase [Bacteroidales bacterium]MBN2698669.1 alpha/beta hydrolase [Bacteroidales bacterium]
MKKSALFKGAKIVYNDTGKGDVLFFLHGYLETRRIWDEFFPLFRHHFRIITMDIPGHGESEFWGEELNMDDLASAVLYIIDREGINKIYLIGHSMGGYITMAFAELYRERLKGYCLFHSTCFADSGEKQKNRDREISLIQSGKKQHIINLNVPKGFADDNLERMKHQVDKAKELAQSCSDEGMIALLRGMKKRPDRSHVLSEADLPLLLIWGEKDNYISGEVFGALQRIAPHASVLTLKNSGHMGFMEEPGRCCEAVLTWMGH